MYIRPVSPGVTPEDLARVPVASKNGGTVTLGDVADVLWEQPLLIGDAVINDGDGLMLIVEKFPWANTLEVTRGVEAALDELRPGLPTIEIDHQIFRPATFIEDSIHNLTVALLIGAVLVVLVLGAFLYEWRVALISLLAIPLSLVAAMLVLYLREATINTMVLAGFVVALGSIVDDAIIDVENIVRRLRQHRKEGGSKSTATIILEASLEIRSVILYATLIIVLAVAPVLFMGGLSGAFFVPLALSYSLALLASMVVALTVTPALCLILLDRAAIERESRSSGGCSGSTKALERIIRAPRPVYLATGAAVVAGIAVWPLLGQSLLPSFKERDFLMHWLTPPGTSHPEMYRVTVLASKELRAIPGCATSAPISGAPWWPTRWSGSISPRTGSASIPRSTTTKPWPRCRRRSPATPASTATCRPTRERVKEVLTGKSESIVVRIFGPELEVLREQAEKVEEALTGIEGLVELHEEPLVDIPQVQVTVDLAKAGAVGLAPGDVRRDAAILFSGHEVTDIHAGDKVYDVMVWSTPETRHSPLSVREALLDTPAGGQVRLGDIADVRIVPSPNAIARENASRRMDVLANVGSGRDLGAVLEDVEDRLEEVQFPLGYHAQLLGEGAERAAAQRRLLLAGLAAVVGIFLLLQAARAGAWRPWPSWPCPRRWWAGCSPPTPATASSRSARWSGSSRSWGSRRGTASS